MTVQEISLVVQMRRILSDRNMFSTLNSLANIKVFNKNSLLCTMLDHMTHELKQESSPMGLERFYSFVILNLEKWDLVSGDS